MTDFSKKYDWWDDACRLKVGLLKRPQPQVPHMTSPKWDPELAELNKFQAWILWKNAGSPRPRPNTFWPRVPSVVYWVILGEYNKKHPHNPPPSDPTEKVSKWKNPPWRGIGVHVAWSFTSGQYSPQQLADRIAGTRVQWAALEGSPALDNFQFANEFRDALHARGKRFGIWERCDRQRNYPESYFQHAIDVCQNYHPDFYGADIEEFPVEDETFPYLFAKSMPDMPKVMLVPGQPAASFLKVWFDNDWDMMTQSYAANIGQPPVPGVAGPTDHDTYWRGGPRNFIPAPTGWGKEWWQHGSGPHSVPIIEVHAEGNPSLRAQADSDAMKWFGGNWSIWSAELLEDDDWDFLK